MMPYWNSYMKVCELLEDVATYNKVIDNVGSSPRRSLLGKGLESAAYTKTTKPDTAYRVGQDDHAAAVLMQMLARNQGAAPMLPHIRATRGLRGGIRVSITDKLLPLSNINTLEEFQSIAAQVIGDGDAANIALDPKVPTPIGIKGASEWLADMVFWYLEHEEFPFTKYKHATPQLVQTRKVLQQVMADARAQGINAQIDHANVSNLMLRPAESGYQLVINDPLTSQR
jgi:hypothetical protein